MMKRLKYWYYRVYIYREEKNFVPLAGDFYELGHLTSYGMYIGECYWVPFSKLLNIKK